MLYLDILIMKKDAAISLELGWICLDDIGLYSDCDYFAIHNFSIEGLLIWKNFQKNIFCIKR